MPWQSKIFNWSSYFLEIQDSVQESLLSYLYFPLYVMEEHRKRKFSKKISSELLKCLKYSVVYRGVDFFILI